MAKGGRLNQILKLFVQSERLPEIVYRSDSAGEPSARKRARSVRGGAVGKAAYLKGHAQLAGRLPYNMLHKKKPKKPKKHTP